MCVDIVLNEAKYKCVYLTMMIQELCSMYKYSKMQYPGGHEIVIVRFFVTIQISRGLWACKDLSDRYLLFFCDFDVD